MASSDPVPEVNKVIVSVGHRRGEGPAASCKQKKGKEASTKRGGQRRREKERDRDHRDHCLPTTGGTTAYLQLTGGLHRSCLSARHHREEKREEKQAASRLLLLQPPGIKS